MNKRQQTQQRGAIALITAMIISVLLLITTSGMVAVTLKSIRASSDGAQSTKAYYAAEGGLEKAILALREGDFEDTCTGADRSESAQDGVVTCTKVTKVDNEIVGEIGADQTKQIDLSSVAGLRVITIEWGLAEGFQASSIPNYLPSADVSSFPEKKDWPSSAPAVMELGVVDFPDGQVAVNEVGFNQGTFTPKSYAPGNPTSGIAIPGLGLYNLTSPSTEKPMPANCGQPGQSAPYQCKGGVVLEDGSGSRRHILRLKARYNNARYRVILGTGNSVLPVPGALYTIDVTARAGDVFRRVQTSFPVDTTLKPNEPLNGLDYVLYSDTDICKSFEIKGGVAEAISCQVP